jgi:hypothetical protein
MFQTSPAINGQGRGGGGLCTPEGRQRQVTSRLSHGIQYQSPVLPGVESAQMWESHLSGIRESLAPVGTLEETLVHKIAFQLWRVDRLIRHETGLVHSRIINPEHAWGDEADKATVLQVLSKSEQQLESELKAAWELTVRYEALCSEASDVIFTPDEVRGFLETILEHIEDNLEIVDDEEPDQSDETEEVDELDIEDRPWPAAEVVEQIKLFSEKGGVDWRSEVRWMVSTKRRQIHERSEALSLARRHVASKLIPSQDDVIRLGVYERQIASSLKNYYNMLQRAQAIRLGQPVAAPIALDVTLSGHDQSLE